MQHTTARLAGFLHDDTNIREKTYAAIGIMEQHCHMMMHNELYGLNADIMRDLAVNAVLSVLKGVKSDET
jgi:hypothetical protein